MVATYTYDALNRRIGIDDNGTQTWTVYDGQNPYADFNGSGTLTERYLNGPAVDQILRGPAREGRRRGIWRTVWGRSGTSSTRPGR